jgi:tetratricopeptide (TPR) repeat protein
VENEVRRKLSTAYRFDRDLREVPDAPDEMDAAVVALIGELEKPGLDASEELQLLGQIGVMCRMLGRLDDAERYLQRAVALSKQVGSERSRQVNRIRLAHVYQWQGRFGLSDPIFEEAVALCERREALSAYLDFALQHYGKSLFDQGRYAEAERLFERALQLRLAKGDDSLAASSRFALDVTRGRLSAGSQALER